MQRNYNLYYNLGYFFMLFIVLVFGGFYATYFSVFFKPMPAFIHVHFILLSLWIVMLIVQVAVAEAMRVSRGELPKFLPCSREADDHPVDQLLWEMISTAEPPGSCCFDFRSRL